MKYNSKNKPLICMQTQSTCYKGTSKMTIRGILWHSTGANNTTIKRYVQPSDVKPGADTYTKAKWLEILGTNKNKNDWNHIKKQAGLNAWIGKLADGTVTTVQTMPWDYKPWGCGSGSKGSCNNGWIQFEICEDKLTDKDYFNKVYTEACELTAYLCQLYNIDPSGTVTVNGVKIPTILCHKDSHKLGFGSNHSDILHWFKKHSKTMDDVRKDVTAILEAYTKEQEASVKKVYRVRKSWKSVASQKGAFSDLKNAIECCQKAGEGYKVFDWNGNEVYAYTAPKSTVTEQTEPPVVTDPIEPIVPVLPEKPAVPEAPTAPDNEETEQEEVVVEPDKIVESDKPEDPAQPEETETPDQQEYTPNETTPAEDDASLDQASSNIEVLVFEVIKKLIKMFADLFSKGE